MGEGEPCMTEGRPLFFGTIPSPPYRHTEINSYNDSRDKQNMNNICATNGNSKFFEDKIHKNVIKRLELYVYCTNRRDDVVVL